MPCHGPSEYMAPGGILEKMVYGGLLILYRAGILLPSVLALAAAVLIWIKKIKEDICYPSALAWVEW